MSESETQSPPTPPGPEPAAAKNPSAGATGDQPAGKATAGDGSAAVAPAGAALENFRRRAIREKEELRQFASVNLLQSLLPILDNLQLGLAAARQQTDTKTVVDGVAMVLEQLKGVLLHHGLKEVNPVGQKFDPHLHESISHQASPDVPEEHVLQVVRIGYTLHGRLPVSYTHLRAHETVLDIV